ncbi:hypothetical protein HanPSC8_Chr05g0203491 [Helianthus annuus]|nr:hypothetical protein HanPSC8_Chr05g0203491 [Helianthus annuus]
MRLLRSIFTFPLLWMQTSEKRRIYDGMVKKGSKSLLQHGYDDGAGQKDKTKASRCHRLDQFFNWVCTQEATGI